MGLLISGVATHRTIVATPRSPHAVNSENIRSK
jgi:hypothetical protein